MVKEIKYICCDRCSERLDESAVFHLRINDYPIELCRKCHNRLARFFKNYAEPGYDDFFKVNDESIFGSLLMEELLDEDNKTS